MTHADFFLLLGNIQILIACQFRDDNKMLAIWTIIGCLSFGASIALYLKGIFT